MTREVGLSHRCPGRPDNTATSEDVGNAAVAGVLVGILVALFASALTRRLA